MVLPTPSSPTAWSAKRPSICALASTFHAQFGDRGVPGRVEEQDLDSELDRRLAQAAAR
jgi:hypothetical protein